MARGTRGTWKSWTDQVTFTRTSGESSDNAKYPPGPSTHGAFEMVRGRKRVLVAAAIVVTATFFAAAFAYGYRDSDGWFVQSVEVCDTRCNDVATAIDDSGLVHVVFQGMVDQRWVVRHAVRSDGDWDVSTVGPAAQSIYGLKLYIDTDSKVHVLWCETDEGFVYAYSTSEGFENIAVQIEDFKEGATVMDSSGSVHGLCSIQRLVTSSWPDYWDWEFQHWTVTADEWALAGTLEHPNGTSFPSVAGLMAQEDGEIRALVAYRQNVTETPFRAVADVTDSGLVIGDPFMGGDDITIRDAELDSQGNMHLVAERYEPGSMYQHCYFDGEYWCFESVDYAGDSSWTGVDLVIDGQDRIYMAYIQQSFAFESSWLKIAEKTDDGWTFTVIQDSGSAFGYDKPALAIDDEGVYHISHFVFDDTNENVMTYANMDSDEVLVEGLRAAAIWTALAAVIGWPTAFAAMRWRRMRTEKRERLDSLGLYDHNLK